MKEIACGLPLRWICFVTYATFCHMEDRTLLSVVIKEDRHYGC